MTALVWALTAAVLYGIGAALQQRQAAATPSRAAGRPGLLLLLVRRPWWLLGIGVELGGFATHAVALRNGPLTIVQMLVASSLLFSVATVRLWSGRRLGWTAWVAVLAVMAGIASFVAMASPAGEDAGVPGVSGHAGLASACLATCAVPLAAAGLAAAGRRRAVLLAIAAGLADAGIAVVTMAFSHVVSGGLTGMAGSWATYALMLGGPCSLLLTQTAYQAGRPMITLPVIAVATPVASLAVGNLMLGESAQLGVLGSAVAALAVLVTVAGLVALARLTTGQPGRPKRREFVLEHQDLHVLGTSLRARSASQPTNRCMSRQTRLKRKAPWMEARSVQADHTPHHRLTQRSARPGLALGEAAPPTLRSAGGEGLDDALK